RGLAPRRGPARGSGVRGVAAGSPPRAAAAAGDHPAARRTACRVRPRVRPGAVPRVLALRDGEPPVLGNLLPLAAAGRRCRILPGLWAGPFARRTGAPRSPGAGAGVRGLSAPEKTAGPGLGGTGRGRRGASESLRGGRAHLLP